MTSFEARVAWGRHRMVTARRAGLGVVVSVFAVCASACGSSPAYLVLAGDGGGNGVGVAHAQPNKPYTFGGLVVCLDKLGLVTIDKLNPVQAMGGLHIDDWVAVPNPFITGAALPFGSADGSIQQLGASNVDPRINMAISTRTVHHTCPTAAQQFDRGLAPLWFYVQFSKPSEATAADTGIAIQYTSGGRHFTLETQWYTALCGPDHRTDLCGDS